VPSELTTVRAAVIEPVAALRDTTSHTIWTKPMNRGKRTIAGVDLTARAAIYRDEIRNETRRRGTSTTVSHGNRVLGACLEDDSEAFAGGARSFRQWKKAASTVSKSGTRK